MKHIAVAIALATATLSAPLPAAAQEKSQLTLQVEQGIRTYGVEADLTGLNTTALAQLKAILNSGDAYLTKRSRIRTILRNNGYDF